ncbi:MAG: GNAT family N-acetyltransferase [Chloroflexota bacterium]
MNVLRKLVNRLRRKPGFSCLVVFAQKLDALLPTYEARILFEFEVLPANADQVRTRLAHIPSEHTFDIEQRIRNGHRCVAAKHLGHIIYANWIAFGKLYSYLLGREYELASNESYVYSAYALPEFRGKGIYPAVASQTNKLLRDWGYKRVYVFMEPHNRAALQMPAKLGYEKIGYTGYVEIFGWRRYFHWDRGMFAALTKRGYWQKG